LKKNKTANPITSATPRIMAAIHGKADDRFNLGGAIMA
jgi:hypothetical protein